jgi:hypothetical protein
MMRRTVIACAVSLVCTSTCNARASYMTGIRCDDRVCITHAPIDVRMRNVYPRNDARAARHHARTKEIARRKRNTHRFEDDTRNVERKNGIIRIATAAGPIVIASTTATAWKGFFRDLVLSGFTPTRVTCYARGGHMRLSLHYTGEACDIDQSARNRTASRMYHVTDIARRWGLRDGCTFRDPDCGHIDTGRDRWRVATTRRWHEAWRPERWPRYARMR